MSGERRRGRNLPSAEINGPFGLLGVGNQSKPRENAVSRSCCE